MTTVTSWWVGKDREAFNDALKDHTDRLVRSGGKAPKGIGIGYFKRYNTTSLPSATADGDVAVLEPSPAPAAVPPPPTPEPTPEATPPAPEQEPSKQKRYRQKLLAAGLCERCSEPRNLYARTCDRCEQRIVERRQRRASGSPWQPGARGTMPKWARPFFAMAGAMRTAVLESQHAKETPALGRAAVVMVCGFFLGQREDWIVAWTGYTAREVKGVIRNLRRAAIWVPERRMACEWLEAFERKRMSKHERIHFDMAFWMDACVAQGTFTRETRDGESFARKELGG